MHLTATLLTLAALVSGTGTGARVELGVDVLTAPDSPFAEKLAGKRLGLVTNPSGVDGLLVPTADRLAADGRFELVQLYGPEHGIRGDAAAGAKVDDAVDPYTKVPVESLYGARRAPSPESLARLDAVVFDIQDVGSRTYTYISTLGEVMQACALARKPLFVLDRPNPLGGTSFEGSVIEEGFKSFIGWGPIPVTHGMTMGEIARLYQQQLGIRCDLTVVPMRGWRRDMIWEDTGLTWSTTSPHIPRALPAHLYVTAGMVAASTANISDAVGTPMPFEAIGAEFVDEKRLADALERLQLAGVRFQPIVFAPFYGKFQGKSVHAVRMLLTDARAFRPLHTAVSILVTLRRMYPEQLVLESETVIGKHWGTAKVLELLRSGASVADIESSWSGSLRAFEKARAQALIY